MKLHVRNRGLALLPALLLCLAGSAALAAEAGPPVAVERGEGCEPEYVIREPTTEKVGGWQGRIDAPHWCGGDAIVYRTPIWKHRDAWWFFARFDLESATRRPVGGGRVYPSGLSETPYVKYVRCSPDGRWMAFNYVRLGPGFADILSTQDGRSVEVPFHPKLDGIGISPNGNRFIGPLRSHPDSSDDPFTIVRMPDWPHWEWVYLNAIAESIYSPIQWSPDSWSFLARRFDRASPYADFWRASWYRYYDPYYNIVREGELGVYDLRRPRNPFTPAGIVVQTQQESGFREGGYGEGYPWVTVDRKAGRQHLQWCRFDEDTQYCETVGEFPYREKRSRSDLYIGESVIFVARPTERSVFFATAEYLYNTHQDYARPREDGAIYRYDRATGKVFRLADVFVRTSGITGDKRLTISLSPDNRRVLFNPKSNPHALHVLNLERLEANQCGVPVETGKE